MSERKDALARLLMEAGRAHHQAYIETDGEDPEWPAWYADHLSGLFAYPGDPPTRSELIYWLVRADREHRERARETPWTDYYAGLFLDEGVVA